ncbi:MAG: hypothetical protein FIB01_14160 [Gemmatimonadetes bacterium]|nr:hypothetical protein [Gemmatimonadota bacterium]
MRRLLQLISGLGLVLTVVPSVLVATGGIGWARHADAMLAGALLWFLTAPFWMREQGGSDAEP